MRYIRKIAIILLTGLMAGLISIPAFSQQYIADYTVAKEEVLREIPEEILEKVRNEMVVSYQHTSHGTHVLYGMYGLPSYKPGDEVSFGITAHDQEEGKLYFRDNKIEEYPPGAEDLSAGETTFVETTRNYLDNIESAKVNVVMWAWCDISGHDVALNYIPGMETLISEYGVGGSRIGTEIGMRERPVTFIFMTGHATTGNNIGDGRPKEQARLIIDHCKANDRYCLDYYSIDTHDMDDNYWEDAGDDGNSESYGGNFYQDFQDAQALGVAYYENRSWPGGSVAYGVHTSQHITSNRKAYAMWWILAQIAGRSIESSSEYVISKSNEIDIYPNPGKGVFNIKLNLGGITNLQLYSMAGKKMFDLPAASRNGNLELDISNFPPGIYILRGKNEFHEAFAEKLILQAR